MPKGQAGRGRRHSFDFRSQIGAQDRHRPHRRGEIDADPSTFAQGEADPSTRADADARLLSGAEIRGRVASLLEVGTGFRRPELSRPSKHPLHVNGAILGMHRARASSAVRRNRVPSAEIERFLDATHR